MDRSYSQTPLPPQPPMAFTVREACAISRVGRSKLYLAIHSGELRARKVGKSTLILRRDLEIWLETQPTYVPSRRPGRVALVAAE
jgi:excisionase family DNA binding protein